MYTPSKSSFPGTMHDVLTGFVQVGFADKFLVIVSRCPRLRALGSALLDLLKVAQ